MINIRPWTQFADLKGEVIKSYAKNITLKNIKLKCNTGFSIEKSDQYELSDFTFENIELQTSNGAIEKANFITNVVRANA